MTDDSQPATKGDLRLLRNELRGELKDNSHSLTLEMGKMYQSLNEKIDRRFEDTIRHFDFVAENIKFDFLHGAIPDKVEQLDTRLTKVEGRLGMRS